MGTGTIGSGPKYTVFTGSSPSPSLSKRPLKYSAYMFNTCCSPATRFTMLPFHKLVLSWKPILNLWTPSKNFLLSFLPNFSSKSCNRVSSNCSFTYIFVSHFFWLFYILLSRLQSFFVAYSFVRCFHFNCITTFLVKPLSPVSGLYGACDFFCCAIYIV